MTSYYEVLEVPVGADEEAIAAAFRRKAQESLMDTEAYELVERAYETLKSPEKRKEYDLQLSQEDDEPMQAPPPSTRPGTAPLRRIISSPTHDIDVTRTFAPSNCPICGHQNAVGDTYCGECGFLLSSAAASSVASVPEPDVIVTPRLENAAGHVYPIKAGLNRVGRENADILILDKTVSRYHGLLVFDEERHLFSVEDAGSSNGTKVNDVVLPPRSSHPLQNEDSIAFGSTKFRLITGEAVIPAEKSDGKSADGPSEIEITMPPAGASPMARLTLQRGRGPQEVLLIPGTISIGRLPDNQISLPGDRFASGHHAQIVVEETVFRLIDVGSTNGSFLNGLRLTTNESIAMSDGDEIVIGSTVFQFQKIARSTPVEVTAAASEPTAAFEVQLSEPPSPNDL